MPTAATKPQKEIVIPGEAFFKRLVEVAAAIGVPPEDLLIVMTNESGLNPAAHNTNGNASGLIQFMPGTLSSMNAGVTHDQVREMPAVKQLDLVQKYFTPYKGRVKNATDLYIATFLPIFLGNRDPSHVLAAKDSPEKIGKYLTQARVYKDNYSLDADKDGKITYGDMTAVVNRAMGYPEYLAAVDALAKYTEYKVNPSKYRGKPPANYKTNDGQFQWKKPQTGALKSEQSTMGAGVGGGAGVSSSPVVKSPDSSSLFDVVKAASMNKFAYIRKIPGGKYRVYSEKGKNLGTYRSQSAAKKRLQQVEFFKHKGQSADDCQSVKDAPGKLDITDIDAFSYSAIVRKLRELEAKTLSVFLRLYKTSFDKHFLAGEEHPDKLALTDSLLAYSKIQPLKLPKGTIKTAALREYGNNENLGKIMANTIKFMLMKIKPESRQKVINNIKRKMYLVNYVELSNKHMPATSSIGQAITFVKTLLMGQHHNDIREILTSIIENL
jgi:hypothetical protein